MQKLLAFSHRWGGRITQGTRCFASQTESSPTLRDSPFSLFSRLPREALELGYEPPLARRRWLPGSFGEGFPKFLSGPRDSFPAAFGVTGTERGTIGEWAKECRPFIDKELPKYGVILLRGLPLRTMQDFASFMSHLQYKFFDSGVNGYRSYLGDNVYTASDDPSAYTMELHNEISYADYFPRKVILFCIQEPGDKCGGETALAINREVLERLDPNVVKRLEEKEIRYQAFLAHEKHPELSLTKTWHERFLTDDRKEVEENLTSQGWSYEWDKRGNLRYWYVHPALLTHPDTGERIFFNQLTSMQASYFKEHPEFEGKDIKDDELVFGAFYGDGTPFEPAVIQHIRNTYWSCAMGFRWRTGDVAVIDNLFALHGRMSWTGERELVTSLTED